MDAMTEMLSKISDFSQEISAFRERYGHRFEDAKTAHECGEENFERYDDLMEWEFAEQGKAYWEQQLEERFLFTHEK